MGTEHTPTLLPVFKGARVRQKTESLPPRSLDIETAKNCLTEAWEKDYNWRNEIKEGE